MKIVDLPLAPAIRRKLASAGMTEVDQLTAANPREILAIAGVGPKAAEAIEAALAARGLHLADDAYAPYVCAREGRAAHDVKLIDLWLCDECGGDFEARPFGGEPPAYVGDPIGGYCLNCVADKASVALHQWFLCAICARAAQSFGQSVVASRGLLKAWNDGLTDKTGIELVEIDAPRLNRWSRSGSATNKVAAVDFEGRRVDTHERVFGLEQKTGQGGIGRGAVNAMAQFQLDCTDCDDMATVAERDDLPVFLVHAQAIQRASAPTRLWVPVGYWWTDPYSMVEHFKTIQNRSREPRPAAYYDVSMFRPLVELADYLNGGGVEQIRQRLVADRRFPPLYQGQARQIRS